MLKRNSRFFVLLLPFAVLFWSIGWFFYWIGSEIDLGKFEKLSTSSDLKAFIITPKKKQVAKNIRAKFVSY